MPHTATAVEADRDLLAEAVRAPELPREELVVLTVLSPLGEPFGEPFPLCAPPPADVDVPLWHERSFTCTPFLASRTAEVPSRSAVG